MSPKNFANNDLKADADYDASTLLGKVLNNPI